MTKRQQQRPVAPAQDGRDVDVFAMHPSLRREGTRLFTGGEERLTTFLPVAISNHSEAYRAYCVLRADLDASFAGGPRVDENATLDAMAGLREMMRPDERRFLDGEGPMVLPDAPLATTEGV